jgi:SSS family solute:Na+ symporter
MIIFCSYIDSQPPTDGENDKQMILQISGWTGSSSLCILSSFWGSACIEKFRRHRRVISSWRAVRNAACRGLPLSANMGALELLGMTGNTFKYGMYVAHFYWIGAIPAMLFLGIYMMPFYYSSDHSIPGYLKLRFDEKTRVLNAIAFAGMTLLMSGINLYAMALVLRTFLGWNWDVSMWVSAVTVAAYVYLGGLLSAIFTEIIQFFLIWFGLFLVSLLGIIEIGGWQEIFKRIEPAMSALWSTSGNAVDNGMQVTWAGVVLGLGFVLSFGYWTTDFLVVQRAFSSKDLRSARMTPIIASFFKMALPFLVIVAGLIALLLSRDPSANFTLLQENGQINYDSALPMLIARYYPEGLIGLGVTALLAGFMAGQAGNVSVSTRFGRTTFINPSSTKTLPMRIMSGWEESRRSWASC